MKPKTISYSESKESVDAIGLKSWRKAGVEIELEEKDVWEDVYEEAKKIVAFALNGHQVTINPDYAHLINNQIGYPNGVGPISLPTIDYSAKESVEKAIDDAKTIHELDLLLGDVAKYGLVKECLKKRTILNTYDVNAK